MPRNRIANLLVATAVGVLFLVGLLLHGGVAAILLIAVVVFLGYLTSRAWPAIPDRGRRFRMLVLLIVAAMAIVKITGH